MARKVLDAVQRHNRRGGPVTLACDETCPFCGAMAILEPYHAKGPAKWTVTCSNQADGQRDNPCDVVPSTHGPTRAVAIARWNRRAKPIVTQVKPTSVRPGMVAIYLPEKTIDRLDALIDEYAPKSDTEQGPGPTHMKAATSVAETLRVMLWENRTRGWMPKRKVPAQQGG